MGTRHPDIGKGQILKGTEGVSRYDFGDSRGVPTYGTVRSGGQWLVKISREHYRKAEAAGYSMLASGTHYIYVARLAAR